MVVNHRSELVSIPDGIEKRLVWLRRPGAFLAPVRGGVVLIHSLMSFTIGMLDSAETSKIRSDLSVYWVTVTRDDAQFTKKRRSSKTAKRNTHPEKGFM